MTVTNKIPHWDMTVVFPGLESAAFQEAFAGAPGQIADLAGLFDRYGIGSRERSPVDQATIEAFDAVVPRCIHLEEELNTLEAYVSSFVATDSRDTTAQARMSELRQLSLGLSQLDTRLTAWVGSIDVAELEKRSTLAADHAFWLNKTHEAAAHLMSQAEENLANELNLSGGSAWSQMHSNVTSQLMVPLTTDGQTSQVPMSVVRNLAYDPDRAVRRAAYEAELDTWSRVAVPLAAALNSIKGETITLDQHRQWESALDLALFNNNIGRATLDAMLQAARESFPDWRGYLHTKARALGLEKLAWYDIFAPVGESSRAWDFGDARDFLLGQFGSYSPRLRDLATRAFEERWIDAEPRPGKEDGAFCMWLRRDESRVLSNFQPSYEGMSTLAHELGHAYHNFNLAERTVLQRSTPMTLAETASIFCETIVREAALQQSDRQEQVRILEASLQGSCQVVVDIYSRFLFESSMFARRSQRELSIEELNDLMLQAQRETYGDGLQSDVLHPYMWAVKGHYYSVDRPFYNFPYMFGLLFGLGLYARYRQDPERFRAGYDQLLSSTGLADAAELAQRFGIDIRDTRFWQSSLDICRQDIDRFAALIDAPETAPS